MCKVRLVALYTDRQTHTDEYNLKVRHSTLRTVTNSFTLRDRNQINASFFLLYFNSSISVTKTNITGRGIIKVHLLLVVKFISLLLVYTTVHKQTHIAHPLNESFRGGGYERTLSHSQLGPEIAFSTSMVLLQGRQY